MSETYGQMIGFDAAIAWVQALEVRDPEMQDHVIARMRYERDKAMPVPPRYIKGQYGRKYDTYQCGNCGYGVNEAGWKYCPNCGRKITEFVAGKRRDARAQEAADGI